MGMAAIGQEPLPICAPEKHHQPFLTPEELCPLGQALGARKMRLVDRKTRSNFPGQSMPTSAMRCLLGCNS